MEAVEGLDGKVRNLDTDIGALQPGPSPPADDLVALAKFIERTRQISALRAEWMSFRTTWGQWVADHYSTLSRTGQTPVTEFERQQTEYNELRRRAAELGDTSAQPSKQDVSQAGKEIPEAIKWGSAAVIAVVLAYALSKAT